MDSVSRIDVQATLESAQSFLWHRVDGGIDEETPASGGDDWYYTVANDDLVFVRQQSGKLEWRTTTDGAAVLRHRLRLDDDLDDMEPCIPYTVADFQDQYDVSRWTIRRRLEDLHEQGIYTEKSMAEMSSHGGSTTREVMPMDNSVASVLHQAKTFTVIAVYILVTFALAGLLAGVLPKSYGAAVLVGWIVAIAIGGKLIRTR